MFSLFKKKTKGEIDWNWIIKKYRECGEFRIFQNIYKTYTIEKKDKYTDHWIQWNNKYSNVSINTCLNAIYNYRYDYMLNIKYDQTYNRRIRKAKYIPPKD